MQRTTRLKRELQMLEKSPPYGISCWQDEDNFGSLIAEIIGSEGTPYEGGVFKIDISITDRYPFEPPKLRFVTPIYHPNIDTGGRICLDTLKMPPQGAWKPSLNIGSVLTTVQLLMAEPNPDDPLMSDIAAEYKYDRHTYLKKAKEWTNRHARDASIPHSKSSLRNDSKCVVDVEVNSLMQKADSKKRSILTEENLNSDPSTSNLKRLKSEM